MSRKKNEDVRSEKTDCGPDLLCPYEIHYDDLVKEGKALLNDMVPKSFRYDPLHRMVNRLENCKDSYLLFIRNYEAPPLPIMRQSETCVSVRPGRKYLCIVVKDTNSWFNQSCR